MKKSKNYFNKVASQWDSMQQSFFSNMVWEKAIEIAQPKRGKLAADIGCGTGFISAALIKEGLNVIAVDQSPAMLERLKSKFNESPFINKIDFRLGDSNSLPIETESVDYVFANMYLHHVENPQMAIMEMTRILKTDGKLVVTDLDKHGFLFLKTEQFDQWLGFKRTDIKKWFGRANLNKIRIDCVGVSCQASSRCCTKKANISIFYAFGIKINAEDKIDVKNLSKTNS